MNKTLLFLFLLIGYVALGQHTISGTFSPAEDYSWLIAYQIKPAGEVYVADTSIDKGKFELKIPEKAEKGTYRLVYAVPQDEFYFDVIFSGNEDIKLIFDTERGIIFTQSKENILFGTYFDEIGKTEQQLIDFYATGKTDEAEYLKLIKNIENLQESYENKSEGLLAQHFIKSNRPYIPSVFETPQNYIANKRKNYFAKIDFTDSVLQGSGFLTNKLANYVFTALPLDKLSDAEAEKEIQKNLNTATNKLQGTSNEFRFELFHSLWEYAAALQLNDTTDYIFENYLKEKSTSEESKTKLEQIAIHNRLRFGAKAPEIEWQKSGTVKKLSVLEGAENYILVFWSSTCSHCLKELPALHKKLKNKDNITVVAVGLEDEELNWKLESEKLETFEHVLALGKWESKYAKIYDIHGTPTYFILDSDKRIIAKPESDKDIIEFLENQ